MKEETSSKKEQVAELFRKQVSGASKEMSARCSKIDKMLKETNGPIDAQRRELEKIKANARSCGITGHDKVESELLSKIKKKGAEVNKAFDELHSTLGVHEEKVRYKDEAERELLALEEIKVMLGNKLRNMAGRIDKLKVRKGSNPIKLLSEARELEEEVHRSGEETLDFEREYTKFLGIMGKLSG